MMLYVCDRCGSTIKDGKVRHVGWSANGGWETLVPNEDAKPRSVAYSRDLCQGCTLVTMLAMCEAWGFTEDGTHTAMDAVLGEVPR